MLYQTVKSWTTSSCSTSRKHKKQPTCQAIDLHVTIVLQKDFLYKLLAEHINLVVNLSNYFERKIGILAGYYIVHV